MRHRMPLGGTGWWVWRDFLLRSTGFPVDGLDPFAARETAAACDRMLDADPVAAAAFDVTFEQALSASAAAACRLAADGAFREAITWQNPAALVALDGLARRSPEGPRNVRRRDREKAVLRYWQRYCAKNETIGFFGPLRWARCTDMPEAVSVRPGTGLVHERAVFFEVWALRAFADRLGADPDVRRWWPVTLRAHLTLAGRDVLRPMQPALTLSTVEADAVRCCDGRAAAEVVAALLAKKHPGVRAESDGYLLLENLTERGVLRWDSGLPRCPEAEQVLAGRIAAIQDNPVRERASAAFERLRAARDTVAAAAGDADAVRVALRALDDTFTELSGAAPRRREGEMYAGRTLVYEDTTRNIELTLGTPVLERLAGPLDIMLRAARWLCAELAGATMTVLRELHREQGGARVPLAELWYLAQGLLWGREQGPAASVGAEFTRRWAKLCRLDAADPGATEVNLSSAELAQDAAMLFDAHDAGWDAARLHSADVQVGATSVDALNRGDYVLVVGELHPSSRPVDSALFSRWHPAPSELRSGMDADIGATRVRVQFPESYPRQTGRTQHGLAGPRDVELGIDDTPGADPARLVPATSAVVAPAPDGELVVTTPDGTELPVLEVFAPMLEAQLLDTFKLVEGKAHTPRIAIDGVVVSRRTWRMTVAGTGLAEVTGERARYLAARAWRRRLGLPDQVFVKIGTETKPCYVDLTGPLHVQVLCTMLRTAARQAGDDTGVTVIELLPTLEQAWLPDADDRRYVSEFRLQLADSVAGKTGEHA